MLTEQEIKSIKQGCKLIFIEDGEVLSTNKGNVFTFANWMPPKYDFSKPYEYWQSKELLSCGNHAHNFSIRHVALFNPAIHKDYKIMDVAALKNAEKAFIKIYGQD